MKHLTVELSFDETRVAETGITSRLEALIHEHFPEVDVRWVATPQEPTGETDADADPFDRVSRLSEVLLRADDLPVMLQTYIEEAPGVRREQAASLRDEIREAVSHLGPINDEETVKHQLANLIDALEDIAKLTA